MVSSLPCSYFNFLVAGFYISVCVCILCGCMYVGICVCMRACMYICIFVCMYEEFSLKNAKCHCQNKNIHASKLDYSA